MNMRTTPATTALQQACQPRDTGHGLLSGIVQYTNQEDGGHCDLLACRHLQFPQGQTRQDQRGDITDGIENIHAHLSRNERDAVALRRFG